MNESATITMNMYQIAAIPTPKLWLVNACWNAKMRVK